MFICKIDGVSGSASLEVPAWMFDLAVCCRFIPALAARVDLRALFSLRELLDQVSARTAVVQAQHHSTVSGGADAQKPQILAHDSAGHLSGDYREAAVASKRQIAAPASRRQTPAPRQSAGRQPGPSARWS